MLKGSKMLKGRIKSYSEATGTGFITPDIPGRDVYFLGNVVEGSGTPDAGRQVEYELYENGDEPEAKKVVLL